MSECAYLRMLRDIIESCQDSAVHKVFEEGGVFREGLQGLKSL